MAAWSDSGTINPAELDSSPPPKPAMSGSQLPNSPRGVKRARSPSESEVAQNDDADPQDSSKPRKRGRPFKSKTTDSPARATSSAAETPQPQNNANHGASPGHGSPPKSSQNNKGLKSLPTVRDHTTDVLNDEGDEYLPREWDEQGETKVTANGNLRGNREYRCRTFKVPHRGEKLFMLATECARVLVYRDSYLLFNKNKSLFKIIANQAEKEDLIAQEILPYSYRSRQIALVTAKSMFRQFGARMITDGRRVRDDYWEQKARKQGFTEEDLASEKRPATHKPKETTTESLATNTNALNILAGNQFVYRELPGHEPYTAGLGIGGFNPMIPILPTTAEEMPPRDYGNVHRPRQDMSAAPYQDRTQSSPNNEVVNQAAQAAEFNKSITQQRDVRNAYMHEAWNRRHEVTTPPMVSSVLPNDVLQAPQQTTGQISPPQMRHMPQMTGARPQAAMMAQQQQHRRGSSAVMNPQAFPHQQMTPSPAQRMQHSLTPGQMSQNRPNFPYDMSGQAANPSMYNSAYNQNQMFHNQSPMAQQQMQQQFAGSQSQQSPHMQQNSHHMTPQMGANSGMGMGGMNFMGMGGMPGGQANFPAQMRGGMFPGQGNQYMAGMASAANQQGNMQGWTGMPATGGQQGWSGF